MKTRDESGALYGKKDFFFGQMPKNFQNIHWIELIGFDKDQKDFGIGAFLDRTGFRPKAVTILMASIDIINNHREGDYVFEPWYCSYGGHEYNDERQIQSWTSGDFKAFVREFKKHGIETYISVFDFVDTKNTNPFHKARATSEIDGNLSKTSFVYMTKRLDDGCFYEDVFLEKAIQFLSDFGLDGLHLADGVCRPRLPIQWVDLSDDMLSQAGICVPEGESRATYIAENKRREWIDFCTKRWTSYMEKVICGLSSAGFKVIINSSWTKDPLEAKYRYGISYADFDRLPIEAVVVENGAPTISILDNEANAGFIQSYEDRKTVSHAFRASLLSISACMENTPLAPLFPVRDTAEQYDVLHHLPTMLSRHAAEIFSDFVWKDGERKPVIEGHTYCLSDGLSKDDWTFLRLLSDNAYVKDVADVSGATVIWSDARNENEIDALIKSRTPSTHRLLTLLLRKGANIFQSAHIRNLEMVRGDIVVTNPHLLPENERKAVESYQNGRVIYVSGGAAEKDYSKELNPTGVGFPFPLYFEEPDEAYLMECVKKINENLSEVLTYQEECRLQEIKLSDTESRFLVGNEEYYYIRPTIDTKRKIRSLTDITKLEGFRVSSDGTTFRAFVPLRGIAIVEVTFEEE